METTPFCFACLFTFNVQKYVQRLTKLVLEHLQSVYYVWGNRKRWWNCRGSGGCLCPCNDSSFLFRGVLASILFIWRISRSSLTISLVLTCLTCRINGLGEELWYQARLSAHLKKNIRSIRCRSYTKMCQLASSILTCVSLHQVSDISTLSLTLR
jgi:hypothetical protein